MKSPMKLLINGETYTFADPKDAFYALLTVIENPVGPLETLQKNVSMVFDIMEEYCAEFIKREDIRGQEQAKYTRLKNRIAKYRRRWAKTDTVESLVKKYWDLILRLEGLAPLPSFGVTNAFGDNVRGNPETTSLRSIYNLIGNQDVMVPVPPEQMASQRKRKRLSR